MSTCRGLFEAVSATGVQSRDGDESDGQSVGVRDACTGALVLFGAFWGLELTETHSLFALYSEKQTFMDQSILFINQYVPSYYVRTKTKMLRNTRVHLLGIGRWEGRKSQALQTARWWPPMPTGGVHLLGIGRWEGWKSQALHTARWWPPMPTSRPRLAAW